MPRYFFHRLDSGFDRDEDGTVCADVRAARVEAILYAAATARDHPEMVYTTGALAVEVFDEQGALVTMVKIEALDAPTPDGWLAQERLGKGLRRHIRPGAPRPL